MHTIRHHARFDLLAASMAALSACAGMSQLDKSTAIGAGVGAVAGAVPTGGGAAVGGVIGHEVGKEKK